MVIYSDESDYEATWRRVDIMFDYQEEEMQTPALWERDDLWNRSNSIRRNYRSSFKRKSRDEDTCFIDSEEYPWLEDSDINEETVVDDVEMGIYSPQAAEELCCNREGVVVNRPTFEYEMCQQDCENLVASIVHDLQDNKDQICGVEYVAPTKIVYPEEPTTPYNSISARRDKRRRPCVRSELVSPSNRPEPAKRREINLSSSANSLESCTLRRSNTICTSGDVHSYLRNRCSRDVSRDGGESLQSFERHSKSTFDSGFESGLSDILDEILGGGSYETAMTDQSQPKATKWKSFKGKLAEAFQKPNKRNDVNSDVISDSSDIKTTKWDRIQQFVKIKIAKVSNQDLDMGGFEDEHWRSLEPRQFHRGTRRTQSFVKWNKNQDR